MLEGYKHLASSIEETPEKQFASLDIKEKINSLENAMVEKHTFNRDIMIKDTSYGIVNINKIEGNTAVNLAAGVKWSGTELSGQLTNMNSDDLRVMTKDNTYCHINCYDWELGKTFFLSPGKLTVCFEVVETPKNIADLWFTFVDDKGGYSMYETAYKIGFGKYCLHINLNPKSAKRLTPRFFIHCEGLTGTSGRLRVRNFSIYEGEHDFNSTQEYITGINAVGEGGAIKLSSCGRNMFNHNLPVVSPNIEVLGDGEYKTAAEWQYIQHLRFPPNRNFYMSAELKTDIHNYPIRLNNIMRIDYCIRGNVVNYSEMPQINEVNMDFLPIEYTKFNSGIFTVNSGDLYDSVSILMRNANVSNLYAKNLMIQEVMTEDDIVHEYEPYVGSEVNIKVDSPLHGLPNGVRDSIELVDGEYVIIRRCKEIKLGSYLSWVNAGIESTTITRFRTSAIPNVKFSNSMVLSNFVPYKQNHEDYSRTGVFASDPLSPINTAYINIDIPNSIFQDTSPTVKEFGTWLNDNDYKIIVELSTPIIEKIENQEEFKKLLMFDGVTHVFGYENTVFPITTIEVPTNLCAEMDSIESAINILEKEVTKMENVGLTSVLTLIDRREEIDNDIQTQDN